MAARVLIVDDEPSILFAVRDFLARDGLTVETCGSAAEARAALDARPFDVLVCDLDLGRGDGLEGLGVIETAAALSSPPSPIVFTARTSAEDVARALVLGACAVFPKPGPLPQLLALVNRLCPERSP